MKNKNEEEKHITLLDNTDVISRMKYGSDGAIPSGNSIVMLNLTRLGKITASTDLTEKAIKNLVKLFLEMLSGILIFIHDSLLVMTSYLDLLIKL